MLAFIRLTLFGAMLLSGPKVISLNDGLYKESSWIVLRISPALGPGELGAIRLSSFGIIVL